jgi:hypothetical protein
MLEAVSMGAGVPFAPRSALPDLSSSGTLQGSLLLSPLPLQSHATTGAVACLCVGL